MRHKALNAVLADLRRLTANPSMGSACQSLTRALREFEKVRRSGKIDEERILRAAALISGVLLDAVKPTKVDPNPKADRRQAG